MQPSNKKKSNPDIEKYIDQNYAYGFVTDIESETIPPGLDENVIRLISSKKNEPEFLLEWRLKAFRHWQKMKTPMWAQLKIGDIDFQSISYFSKPKQENVPKSLDEVDPKLLLTY